MSEQIEGPPSNEPVLNRPAEGTADLPPSPAPAPQSTAPLELPPAGVQPAQSPAKPSESGFSTFLRKLVAEANAIVAYYFANRKALGMALADRFSLLPKSMSAGRDIRISADTQNDAVEKSSSGWAIRLPDCCAVCGNPTDRDWTEDVKQVQDLSWPLYGPMVGLFSGLALNVYFWNRWYLPGTLIAGFIGGYRGRRQVEVRLHVRRCADHADRTGVPSVRALGGELVLRVGNRRVKQRFVNPEVLAWEVATPASPVHSPETPSPFPTEDNIPDPGQMMKLDDGPITGKIHSFQDMPGETGLIFSAPDNRPTETFPEKLQYRPPETPQPPPSNGETADPLS